MYAFFLSQVIPFILLLQGTYSINRMINLDNLDKAYSNFCGLTCYANGTLIAVPRCNAYFNLKSYCFPCNCHDDCYLFGTCCPLESNNTQLYRPHVKSNLELASEGENEKISIDHLVNNTVRPSPVLSSNEYSSSSKPDEMTDVYRTSLSSPTPLSSSSTLSDSEIPLSVSNSSNNNTMDIDFEENESDIIGLGLNSAIVTFADRIKCHAPFFTSNAKVKYGFLMVYKCSETWVENSLNNDTMQACESPTNDSFENFTPYSDTESGLTFVNAHCAICNFFDPYGMSWRFKSWRYRIECFSYQLLYTIIEDIAFFKNASSDDSCLIFHDIPDGFIEDELGKAGAHQTGGGGRGGGIRRGKRGTKELAGDEWEKENGEQGRVLKLKTCPRLFTEPVDSTGSCPEGTDPELKRLCAEVDPQGFGIAYSILNYRNIYCARCHGLSTFCYSSRTRPDLIRAISPFQLLFGLSRGGSRKRVVVVPPRKCGDHRWENNQVIEDLVFLLLVVLVTLVLVLVLLYSAFVFFFIFVFFFSSSSSQPSPISVGSALDLIS